MKSSIIPPESDRGKRDLFKRSLDLSTTIENKSIFLLGPRQTGKSTYLKACFPKALYIDLLHPKTFLDISSQTDFLESLIAGFQKNNEQKLFVVIVDEIQKQPELLDEIHRLIEKDKRLRFILTGSSARKLKRQGVNLLGGRARRFFFHPITLNESLTDLDDADSWFQKLSHFGGLPHVLLSNQPHLELNDYVGLYLQEEIQNEALTRSVPSFARFLKVAAASNTEQIIFSTISSDALVPARTVREYFQILEDTLIGNLLPAFEEGSLRKPMTSPKFYLFDVGVANSLTGRIQSIQETPEFGKSFEHFVYCEIRAAIDYLNPEIKLFYWRTVSKFEVDFILQKPDGSLVAIEAKSSQHIGSKELSGLKAFSEEFNLARKIVVCRENRLRLVENEIEIMPVLEFSKLLWEQKIF